MTGNRLINRRAAEADEIGSSRCAVGYSDPHAWCSWANGEKRRDDVFWIVGPNGTPTLIDDEDVCAEMHRKDRAMKEREAHRHNHRIMHPMDQQSRAA